MRIFFFIIARITDNDNFETLNIVKCRYLVELRHYPGETEIYSVKYGLLGDFGGHYAACGER